MPVPSFPGKTLVRNRWLGVKQWWTGRPPGEPSLTERWDREWIHYFNIEDPKVYFLPYTGLTLAEPNLGRLSAREVYEARLARELLPLKVYMPGNLLAGARVVEVGCGPGYLCKQLGLVAAEVVGIDHSPLALSIARLVSPPTCRYYHASRVGRLRRLHGRLDCMVCRHFFIHQNYESGLKVLTLARRLLRPGGLVGADFYQADLVHPDAKVFPARSPLSASFPSCAFLYSPRDIEELAQATGFRVTETWDNPSEHRRLVLLERR
jgi:SAM-dependent methyltransferase